MVAFQALTWESRDTDDEHLISIFGKTEEGKSVCLTTAFTPYFFIKLPGNIDTAKIQRIYNILDENVKILSLDIQLPNQKMFGDFKIMKSFHL